MRSSARSKIHRKQSHSWVDPTFGASLFCRGGKRNTAPSPFTSVAVDENGNDWVFVETIVKMGTTTVRQDNTYFLPKFNCVASLHLGTDVSVNMRKPTVPNHQIAIFTYSTDIGHTSA